MCVWKAWQHGRQNEAATREEWDKYEVIGNLARNCKGGGGIGGWMIKLWWHQRLFSSLWSIGQSLKHDGTTCHNTVIDLRERSGPRPEGAMSKVSRKGDEAEQEATLLLNCCMCASFSFTCCDTKPPGAICSCCFISHSNQQGHKDPANKGGWSGAVMTGRGCLLFFLATYRDSRLKSDKQIYSRLVHIICAGTEGRQIPIHQAFSTTCAEF